jgi:hypothetical protein
MKWLSFDEYKDEGWLRNLEPHLHLSDLKKFSPQYCFRVMGKKGLKLKDCYVYQTMQINLLHYLKILDPFFPKVLAECQRL